MKILFFDNKNNNLKQNLEDQGFECITKKENNNDIIGLIVRNHNINSEIINQFPKLKFIARAGSGIENIDQKYCKTKNIKIIRSPEGNAPAVAEHCLAMMLNLTRNISKSNDEIKQKKWIRENNRSHELKNKTITIIGYGHTGQAFAKILKNFKIKVLTYDKYKHKISDKYAQETDLETIFSETDILSIHIDYRNSNKYFINYDFLSSFKKTLYIINTSRGNCVETSSIIKLIKDKKILGAALDVIEYEYNNFKKLNLNNTKDFDFLKKSPQVIMTPHIAGITHESKIEIEEILFKKIMKII